MSPFTTSNWDRCSRNLTNPCGSPVAVDKSSSTEWHHGKMIYFSNILHFAFSIQIHQLLRLCLLSPTTSTLPSRPGFGGQAITGLNRITRSVGPWQRDGERCLWCRCHWPQLYFFPRGNDETWHLGLTLVTATVPQTESLNGRTEKDLYIVNSCILKYGPFPNVV